MYLTAQERDIVIRALTKVLESEPRNTRTDEYKKLLDRLKQEQEAFEPEEISQCMDYYDMDDT